ncbi:MAG: PorV/PorQ family protein [bacterium]|nr:PorV/PorQ family protein [bacterium]
MMILFCLLLGLGDTYLNDFMGLGVGARALGMGNAFVGIADDATAVYWNSSGLAKAKKKELFLMHSGDFDDAITINSGMLAYPLKNCTIGAGFYILSAPGIPLTDTVTTDIVIDTGTINATDYISYAAFAVPFGSLNLGLTLKYIYRSWVVANTEGVTVDFGMNSKFNGISYGASIENLVSTPFYWSDTLATNDELPVMLKYGLGLEHNMANANSKINICLGFDTSLKDRIAEFTSLNTDAYLGMEYWWKQQLALRIGEDRGNLTLGCGIIYQNLKVDYAFKFHPDLGLVKRLSGSLCF